MLELNAFAQVISIVPNQNAPNVSPTTIIRITFSTAMDPSTFRDTSSFLVYGRTSGRHRGAFSFSGGNTVATFTPTAPFMKGEIVLLDATYKLKTGTGATLIPFMSQFTVIANPGTGRFPTKVDYATGQSPLVFVSDLNGDGHPDIVAGNTGDSSVSVFINNGDGTFAPGVRYWSQQFHSFFVGDVDGDGNPDIVVPWYDVGGTMILRNNGDGTFSERLVTGAGLFGNSSVFVSDVDGDGFPDIVTSGISVLLNNEDGTFAAPLNYGGGANSVFVSDVDGDGFPDIVTSGVSVLLNNGDGTFAAPVNYGGGSNSVFVSDVNGDGHPDIVTSGVSVLLNNGDGTFAAPVNYGGGSNSVFVSDVDGDGFPDIVTSGISVLLNKGDGTFAAPVNYAGGGNSVFVSDVDGDGAGDIVVGGGQTVSVFKNIINDVAVVSTGFNNGFMSYGSQVAIAASVENFSVSSKAFSVLAQVDTMTGKFSSPKFSSTQTVTSLGSNQTQNVSFGNWNASSNGLYKLRLITELPSDENHSNDTLLANFIVLVQTQSVLVVYQDSATGGQAVKNALTTKGYLYDEYNLVGDLSFSLSRWQLVVWIASQDAGISNANADSINSFLYAGNRLILFGNQLASSESGDVSSTPRAILFRQNIGINWVRNFSTTTTVNGITGDSVGNGISLSFALGSGLKEKTTRAGSFSVLDSTMTYSTGGNAGWKRDAGNYKIVYAGFPIQNATPDSMRATFLDQAMRWLVSSSGLGIIQTSSSSINFGAVKKGSNSTRTVSFRNTSINTLVVDSIYTKTMKFSPDIAAANVASKESLLVSVTFTPDTFRTYTDTLYIRSNSTTRLVKVWLIGDSPYPLLAFSDTVINFGSIKFRDTVSKRLTVSNTSINDAVIDTITHSLANVFHCLRSHFAISGGRTDTLLMQFIPDTIRDYMDTLDVWNNSQRPVFTIALHGAGAVTGIKGGTNCIPKDFALEQNYPNPFNPRTAISYALPIASDVRLRIYNLLGQAVATLAHGVQDAGYKTVEWNAGSVASGLYIYRLEATSVADPLKAFMQTRKMVLIK
jgi:uncharacterized protein YfaP (DUF2135 family)